MQLLYLKSHLQQQQIETPHKSLKKIALIYTWVQKTGLLTVVKWNPDGRDIWSWRSPLAAVMGSMWMICVSLDSLFRSLLGVPEAACTGGCTPFRAKVVIVGPPFFPMRSRILMTLLLVSATYSFPVSFDRAHMLSLKWISINMFLFILWHPQLHPESAMSVCNGWSNNCSFKHPWMHCC